MAFDMFYDALKTLQSYVSGDEITITIRY